MPPLSTPTLRRIDAAPVTLERIHAIFTRNTRNCAPISTRKPSKKSSLPAKHRRVRTGPSCCLKILEVLAPQPGEFAVDCTLGYGGHSEAILRRTAGPGAHLLALDVDPIEGPRTAARLLATGFGPDVFSWERRNFAGLAALLAARRPQGADVILADLGVSSMQLDVPERGFSVKNDGPLDMRMNPQRGMPASEWLAKTRPETLTRVLTDNADEPRAVPLAAALAGRTFPTTISLAAAIAAAVPSKDQEDAVRRVFQAVRIAVNDELSALDTFLRTLPGCLAPGGRVAILSFHSGEDRRVKLAFREGHRAGVFSEIAPDVIRPGAQERRENLRAGSAKLRWAKLA